MKQALSALLCILLLGTVALAAPSLPVTKPPVQPVPSYTGPTQDPHAVQGQWFKGVVNDEVVGAETARPYEFYDNVIGHGGGDLPDPSLDSWLAIYGKVTSVTLQGGNITAFTIKARITNDNPGDGLYESSSSNSHGEGRDNSFLMARPLPLLNTKLTASFALQALNNVPSAWTGAYREGPLPFIIADNEDEAGWYCWTPDNPDPEKVPWGGYYVPTWDFGDIPVGGFSERELFFSVAGAGIPSTDPRYGVIEDSYYAAWGAGDVFVNRTTSLKISNWLDNLVADTGIPYPVDPLLSSDVSVFHDIPEPATLGLLALGGLALLRRRRA